MIVGYPTIVKNTINSILLQKTQKMDRDNLKEILTIANSACKERYGTTLYNKLELRFENEEDLINVLSASNIDDVMTSGRVDFYKQLSYAVKAMLITSTTIGIILGTIAGMSTLLKPEYKLKADIYADIIRQLYLNPTLYNAIKHVEEENLSPQEAADKIMNELSY